MNVDISAEEPLINFYSFREEIANTLTHGVGIIAALAAIPILCVAAYGTGWLATGAVLIYALALLSMYLFSTVYHGMRNDRWKLFFRRLDYCAIYLLIAGTYTPLLLLSVGGKLGWAVLIVLWSLAGVGITIKCFTMKECGGLSLYLYLIMGWGGIVCIESFLAGMSGLGIFYMFAGGFAYCAGIFFFLGKRPYSHTLWHLFVLTGSTLHFVMILTLL